MWICTSKGFLSVVADRDNKDMLLVRARIAGHIESAFPDADIFYKKGSDYLYRTLLPRTEVAKVMAKNIEAIDYDNFKNSVKDREYHDALLGFWNIMYRLQDKLNPFTKKKTNSAKFHNTESAI
jgi:hypothetical protein